MNTDVHKMLWNEWSVFVQLQQNTESAEWSENDVKNAWSALGNVANE
jgi:hypothetical protein